MAKDSTKQQEIDTNSASSLLEEGMHHVNNPVLDLPEIVKNYLGPVAGYHQENNNYYFSDGSATVEVKVVSDEIIRVRLAPNGQFLEDFSYAVPRTDQHVAVYNFEEDQHVYRVKTNTVTCVVNKADFLISFEDREGQVYNRDYSHMHWEENPGFGCYYVYSTKTATANEAFYGLGDKPTH